MTTHSQYDSLKKIFILLLFTCFNSLLHSSEQQKPSSNTQSTVETSANTLSGNTLTKDKIKAAIIPVEGMVKELLYKTITRRTEQALKDGCKVIVYRIKSDGGELGAAFKMSNYVFGLDKNIKTIAFVEEKAYSAAALFSLACDELYMKPLSSIGDCEPILMTQGGYTTAGEKIQSPLRERFRSYARENGYPILLAQSMVSSELKILSVKEKSSGNTKLMRSEDWEILGEERQKEEYDDVKIVSHKGDLLTLGHSEAIEHGFSSGTFETPEKLLEHLGYTHKSNVIDLNQTERVINTMEGIAPILIIAAIFFLYLELKTPGIGIFGAISAVAFAAFFVGKYYEGQANYLEVTLFILSIALILMEVFVFPGFGVAGIAGVILLFLSLLLAMQDFTIPSNQREVDLVIGNMSDIIIYIFIASILFIGFFFILPKSRFKFIPGLVHDDHQETHPLIKEENRKNLVGKIGLTTTELMPGGQIDIDGQIHSAAVQSGWADKGKQVVVIVQEGNQLLVKLDERASQEQNEPNT